MNHMDRKIAWCIEQHRNTNHYYDTYLPYEFHLRMVVQAFKDFKHLLSMNLLTKEEPAYHNTFVTVDETLTAIENACWGHDLIEDTRVSWNDVKAQLGINAANIIFAVTNEKGKSRKERANDKYYEGIRNTPGAVFVKLCDRIANAQYSKMTKSRMFEMYKKENDHFCHSLGYTPNHELVTMFEYLYGLFEDK
jgi:(p)ppGpp synthase/HD superfamily hydrolase